MGGPESTTASFFHGGVFAKSIVILIDSFASLIISFLFVVNIVGFMVFLLSARWRLFAPRSVRWCL